MNFSDIREFIDSLKIPGTELITPKNFNEFFVVRNAIGDGNCLFHSVSTLVPQYNHTQLRKMVCDYYKTFNRRRNYPDGTLKNFLKIQLISDDNLDNRILHERNICKNRVWGGMIDVIVLADVLNTNIIVMINYNGNYYVNTVMHDENSPTIIIKYNGINHFEPVQFRTNDSSLRNHLSKAKSATPGMLREIEEMDKKDKKNKISKNQFLKNAEFATPGMLREIEEIERLYKKKEKTSPKTITNRLIKQLETRKKTLKGIKPATTNTKKIIKKIETKQNYLKNAKTVSPDILREIQALALNEAKTVSPETMRLINGI